MARAQRTIAWIFILTCVLMVVGCKDEEKEQALAEAEASRMELVKIKAALKRANRELSDLKEELLAVKETRNKLQAQVDQIIKEHGSVVAQAGNAQETIRQLTARSENKVSTLLSEIAELKALTETQKATIEELQNTIEQLQGTTGDQEEIMEEAEEPIP